MKCDIPKLNMLQYFSLCYIFFFVNLLVNEVSVSSNEILGCGGFIKSYVPIDFSKIEVKLYTKQGVLKDKTYCAPNNGYYFLPVYDQGEYLLKIEPPTGWSFKPTSVFLEIGGAFDPCTEGKDINFVFEGFGITGQVRNIDNSVGPSGISISLLSDGEKRTTTTSEEGNFYFTPVYPGVYTITAAHPRWKFISDKITIQVSSGHTELPKNSLIVSGYDASGSITFSEQPIKDIFFFLFSDDDNASVKDCSTKGVVGYTSSRKYLCYVTSSDNGRFSFPSLSPAHYTIVPFYERDNIKYNFHPEEVNLQVLNDSIVLQPEFKVQSFNVKGKLIVPNGTAVSNAKVFVNGTLISISEFNGLFILNKLAAGSYEISVKSDRLKFSPVIISLKPEMSMKDLIISAKAFEICGHVNSEKSHSIIIKKIDDPNGKVYKTNTEVETGKFCHFVPAGKYIINVFISEDDVKNGIQFFPVTQNVEVNSDPIDNLNFSQLKAKIEGTVKCIRPVDCKDIAVILKHIPGDNKNSGKEYIAKLENGNYVFDEVMPGQYKVRLDDTKLCWQANSQMVNIDSKVNMVQPFIQTGYILQFLSSHNTQVHYQSTINDSSSIKTISIEKGLNSLCIENPGVYHFHLKSCHLYENNEIEHTIDSGLTEIVLNATKHLTTVEIQSQLKIENLQVAVTINNATKEFGPLNAVMREDQYYYKIEVYLNENESATITPKSDSLWLIPTSWQMKGSNDCMDYGPQIVGFKGTVLRGQVEPPLQGVRIAVSVDGKESLVTNTNEMGVYQFPTLDGSKTYSVIASKQSYTFIGPDEHGNFKAHKLAEIIVEVVDKKTNLPLQGVLISLSGGDSYRSNLQTNINGSITFSSLSPSDYFLKPMMKEYNFDPSSKIISVKEGTSVVVEMFGQRVAYSIYGTVTSLNNEPIEKVTVSASGTGICQNSHEETTSEENGQFRIRGLRPSCSYSIDIKDNLNRKFERIIPGVVNVQMKNEDVHKIKLTAAEKVSYLDTVVHIWTSKPENFRNLLVKLCTEQNPNTPVYNVKIDPIFHKAPTSNFLVNFSPIPVDNKTYFVELDMGSSSSAQNYRNNIKHFVANSTFKYIKMYYEPQLQNQEQDIGQKSILALPFIIIVIFSIYVMQNFSKFKSINVQNIISSFKKENAQYKDIVEDEMDYHNGPKRKVKPRKI